jgi:hypothetical protein
MYAGAARDQLVATAQAASAAGVATAHVRGLDALDQSIRDGWDQLVRETEG